MPQGSGRGVMAIAKLVTSRSESSAECADILREALADAEAGNVVSLFVVTLDGENGMASAWHDGDRFATLLGAVTIAQRDMIEDASSE